MPSTAERGLWVITVSNGCVQLTSRCPHRSKWKNTTKNAAESSFWVRAKGQDSFMFHCSSLENQVQEEVSINSKWTDVQSVKCNTLPSAERSSAGGRGRKNVPKPRGHPGLTVTAMSLAFTMTSYHCSLSFISEKDAADHVAVLPGSQAQTGPQTGLLWSHRLWLFNWWKL